MRRPLIMRSLHHLLLKTIKVSLSRPVQGIEVLCDTLAVCTHGLQQALLTSVQRNLPALYILLAGVQALL